jgi:hypothetical protein
VGMRGRRIRPDPPGIAHARVCATRCLLNLVERDRRSGASFGACSLGVAESGAVISGIRASASLGTDRRSGAESGPIWRCPLALASAPVRHLGDTSSYVLEGLKAGRSCSRRSQPVVPMVPASIHNDAEQSAA